MTNERAISKALSRLAKDAGERGARAMAATLPAVMEGAILAHDGGHLNHLAHRDSYAWAWSAGGRSAAAANPGDGKRCGAKAVAEAEAAKGGGTGVVVAAMEPFPWFDWDYEIDMLKGQEGMARRAFVEAYKG